MQAKNNAPGAFPEFQQFHLPSLEWQVQDFWKQQQIFEKSISTREGASFVFYEGPPSANGKPGIHHVMSRTIKDLFCRYKTLQGFRVERKAGWDTHGLPVELNVEKHLGITKKDIGSKISIAEYNKHCREDVLRYTDVWNDLTQKMGYWVDLQHPYITYENNYIETLWQLLKKLFDKGLLYQGYTIQPYSPAAGTGLSSHELNQPGCYRDVKDITAVAQFEVKRDAKSEFLFAGNDTPVYLLAWTTTPWTLPSNVALAVGADIEYVLIETENFYTRQPVRVMLAADLVEKVFGWNNLPIHQQQAVGKGAQLAGLSYEQLLPFSTPTGKAFEVITGDFVTTTDGTGIVHIAPSHGADDMRVARENGIATDFLLVDRQGKFTAEVGEFAGEFVKEDYYTEEEKAAMAKHQGRDKYLNVDIRIVDKLKKEGLLFKSEKYEHTYPHCWRTDKPVIYYPLDSWFIKTTALKQRLIELNKTINWKPASTGEGRFGQWLESLVDWNLSRSRYWGTPLPIWKTADGSEMICIGSVAELKAEIDKAVKAGVMQPMEVTDLHKPFVDEITLVSVSGKPMKREPDLIDVWFDSGAMPYAQWHWPFENEAQFQQNFPADFIAEGVDQTRGWFFTLHVLAVALFDSVAYKNVVSNGLLLDAKGQKMSKRLGNVVDPFDTIEKYGADATRWYMMRNSDPWDNLKFDIKALEETSRAHFGTLYNTYSFLALYANIDGWKMNESAVIPVAERTELDRWILSKLHSLVKEVTAAYDDYEPLKAARAIELFTDAHLSNWYVRLSRRRFWKGDMSADKQAAYETLYECLMVVGQLMSPITPFFSEWLYQSLTGNIREAAQANQTPLRWESVHLTQWTKANEAAIDGPLEARMDLAQRLTSLVLSLRKKSLVKVRQPLQKILIPVTDASVQEQLQKVQLYILNEVNVKEMVFVTDTAGMVKKKAKPDFKKLGKKAGSMMKELKEAVGALTQEQISELEKNQRLMLLVNQSDFELLLDEVEIIAEDIPGWLVANDGSLTVALDVTITDALRHEGVAREFVNKVQNLRKDQGFQVLDRIVVRVEEEASLRDALQHFGDYVSNEILSNEISMVPSLPNGHVVEFNDGQLKLEVAVVS
ncbi:MAG: isoleucine--tRNA ligase [Chitinophagales bacterium]